MSRPFPNFLLIGAQKSGTTFLQKCLTEHPEVLMPPGETRIFENPEYLETNPYQFFEELFGGVPEKKAVGIKRPAYLAKPECPQRIRKHIPHAKLVAILRNPVERAVSAYFHYMKCGFIPIRSLEEGMTKLIRGDYRRSYPKSPEIIGYGQYHRHLARYLTSFDRDQMLILFFESLRANPLESIKKVYRFLGVDDGYAPQSLRLMELRNPGVYSLTRLRLITLGNPFLYSYAQDKTKRFRQSKLFARAVNKAVTWIDERLVSPLSNKSNPGLSSSLERCLYKLYEEDIQRLEDLLGTNLANWKLQSTLAGQSLESRN